MTDEELQQAIINFAINNYQKPNSPTTSLNQQLTRWMRANGEDTDKLNELYNQALDSIQEACPEAYDFMDSLHKFGLINWYYR